MHIVSPWWYIALVRRLPLAPLNRLKPSSKIFYWPFQGGTSFVDLLCFCSVLCLLCFVRAFLYVLCGHLLGKGWPLGSRLWCLLWVCHFPIGILGQVWYLIVSIPDLCTITYFHTSWTFLVLQHQQTLGRRFGTSKMHLPPPPPPQWFRLLSVLRRWLCCSWLFVYCKSK